MITLIELGEGEGIYIAKFEKSIEKSLENGSIFTCILTDYMPHESQKDKKIKI